MKSLKFDIEARSGRARAGLLATKHGVIRTPAFSPVGTKAGVKGVLPETLKKLGAQVVLANTYHLYLQPGEVVVKEAGGLGKFMGWSGPTMTDSGGFQVFSLGAAFGKTITTHAIKASPCTTRMSQASMGSSRLSTTRA
jgi:queuine tRNA-ribosyltransferase